MRSTLVGRFVTRFCNPRSGRWWWMALFILFLGGGGIGWLLASALLFLALWLMGSMNLLFIIPVLLVLVLILDTAMLLEDLYDKNEAVMLPNPTFWGKKWEWKEAVTP